MVQWLILVPVAPPCPELVQNLPIVQLSVRNILVRVLKWTLKYQSPKLDYKNFISYIMKRKGSAETSFFHQPVNPNLSLLLPSKSCCAQNLKHHAGSLSSCEKVFLIIPSKKPETWWWKLPGDH